MLTSPTPEMIWLPIATSDKKQFIWHLVWGLQMLFQKTGPISRQTERGKLENHFSKTNPLKRVKGISLFYV